MVDSSGTDMKIIRTPFRFNRDLEDVRMFLLDIFNRTGVLHYLIPIKVENQKFGPCGPDYSLEDDEAIKIWRGSNKNTNEIIAVSHRGSAGNYHVEIHPEFKPMERELFQEIGSLRTDLKGIRSLSIIMFLILKSSLPGRQCQAA